MAPSDEEALAALGVLAKWFAHAVANELRHGELPDYYDQTSSPLGPREHCRLIRNGDLPVRRLGRRYLAKRSDVEAYVASRDTNPKAKAKPTSETDAERETRIAARHGIKLVRKAG